MVYCNHLLLYTTKLINIFPYLSRQVKYARNMICYNLFTSTSCIVFMSIHRYVFSDVNAHTHLSFPVVLCELMAMQASKGAPRLLHLRPPASYLAYQDSYTSSTPKPFLAGLTLDCSRVLTHWLPSLANTFVPFHLPLF